MTMVNGHIWFRDNTLCIYTSEYIAVPTTCYTHLSTLYITYEHLCLVLLAFVEGGGHLIETNNSHTFKILPLKTDLDYYSTCKIHITKTFPKISQLFHVDLKLVDFYGIFFQFWVFILTCLRLSLWLDVLHMIMLPCVWHMSISSLTHFVRH